jgi:hypothetical protein
MTSSTVLPSTVIMRCIRVAIFQWLGYPTLFTELCCHGKAITTLMDTAETICEETNQTSELQHVKFVLRAKGCSLQDINRETKNRPANKSKIGETDDTAYLPNTQRAADHIYRLLKKKAIHTIHKPLNKMASRFTYNKSRQVTTQKSGAYKICFQW